MGTFAAEGGRVDGIGAVEKGSDGFERDERGGEEDGGEFIVDRLASS